MVMHLAGLSERSLRSLITPNSLWSLWSDLGAQGAYFTQRNIMLRSVLPHISFSLLSIRNSLVVVLEVSRDFF